MRAWFGNELGALDPRGCEVHGLGYIPAGSSRRQVELVAASAAKVEWMEVSVTVARVPVCSCLCMMRCGLVRWIRGLGVNCEESHGSARDECVCRGSRPGPALQQGPAVLSKPSGLSRQYEHECVCVGRADPHVSSFAWCRRLPMCCLWKCLREKT